MTPSLVAAVAKAEEEAEGIATAAAQGGLEAAAETEEKAAAVAEAKEMVAAAARGDLEEATEAENMASAVAEAEEMAAAVAEAVHGDGSSIS